MASMDEEGSDVEEMDVGANEDEEEEGMRGPSKESSGITKSDSEGKRFQKEIWQLRLLPYYEQIQRDADTHFAHIKTGLAHSVLLRDARPGLIYWAHELDRFLTLYSRRFTKQDHLAMVRLLHSALTMEDLDFRVAKSLSGTLSALLARRDLLSREELVLDWRPLYNLYVEVAYKHLEEDGVLLMPEGMKKALGAVILECNLYFPASATQEILDEVRPFVCPWDESMSRALSVMNLFLPTALSHEQHDQFGAKLWFDECWHWFTSTDFSSSYDDKLLSLFARLAKDSPGYIDWSQRFEPLFSRLLRTFKLEVSSARVKLDSSSRLFGSIAHLIAYTLGGPADGAQPHLNQLFSSIQNYFHPSNSGSHTSHLLTFILKLVNYVMYRLSRERYHPNRQPIKVPSHMCLTDEQVDAFVLSILPCLKFAAFSKMKQDLVPSIMRILAFLAPGIILPEVLDLVYPALETLTEPHRLAQSLHILACICIPLVRDDPTRSPTAKRFPIRAMGMEEKAHLMSFRSHALTILLNILPGIDVNDIVKSTFTFQIIGILLLLVPVVDCSDAPLVRDDLTEEEKALCSATAQFDSLVEQLMQKTHAILYSLAHQATPLTDAHSGRPHSAKHRIRSTEETVIERGVLTVYKALARNCSSQIYNRLLEQFMELLRENQFIDSRPAMETMGRIASILISDKMETAFPMLFNFLSAKLKKLLSAEEVFNEEEVDPHIVWYATLVADTFRGVHGHILCRHRSEIDHLLGQMLKFKSKEALPLISGFVQNILGSLTLMSPIANNQHVLLDQPLEKYLPVRNWARVVDKSQWKLNWHIPSDEEVAYAQQLVEKLVVGSWETLAKARAMSDTEVLKQLTILRCSMEGVSNICPYFDGEVMSLIPMATPNVQLGVAALPSGVKGLTSPTGGNLRRYCYDELEKLANYLLAERSHDTKSFFELISLLRVLLHVQGIDGNFFHMQYTNFQHTKRILADPLRGSAYNIESVMEGMLVFLHAQRQLHRPMVGITPTHLRALKLLVRLGIAPYSTVRIEAQKVLDASVAWWTFSYDLVLEDILEIIRRPSEAHKHEEFKGAFYMLLNGKEASILLRQNWNTLLRVWPTVIRAHHSDKPSVTCLYEMAQSLTEKSFTSFQIGFTFPEGLNGIAMELLTDYEGNVHKPLAGWGPVVLGREAEEAAKRCEKERNDQNEKTYYELCAELLKMSLPATTTSLHWRHVDLAQSALALLLRRDMRFPDEAVLLYFRLLAGELLKTRKVALSVCGSWLKITKPKAKKIVCEMGLIANNGVGAHWPIEYGYREDNCRLVLYDEQKQPRSEQEWNTTPFLFKAHHGFYTWPAEFRTYAPVLEQQTTACRPLEAMRPVERAVVALFSDEVFMAKFIHLTSLEEKKGHDEFNAITYSLFYRLFRNYSTHLLPHFAPHLEKLLEDKREGAQRLASEIVAGLVNGSKLWAWKLHRELVEWLQPRLTRCLETMTTEAEKNWGTSLATIYGTCEPRKISWINDVLFTLAQKSVDNSFQMTTRFYLLHSALNQQSWRIPLLWRRLYQLCMPHIASAHRNLRYRIGGCLAATAMCDVEGRPGSSVQLLNRQQLRLVTIVEVIVTMNSVPEVQELWAMILGGGGGEQRAATLPSSPSSSSLAGTATDTMSTKRGKQVVSTLVTVLYSLSSVSVHWVTCDPLIELVPLLAHYASLSHESQEEELSISCQSQLLHAVAPSVFRTADAAKLVAICERACAQCNWWKMKLMLLKLLQIFTFANQYTLVGERESIARIVLQLLCDAQIEVRVAAAETLCGLVQCAYFDVDDNLVRVIKEKAASANPLERHAGVLALAAVIQAFPYTVPAYVPALLMVLCKHMSDPQPIYGTVKKALSEFKRTHQDCWHEHKQEFSEEQLSILTDLLVSPNYYV